MYRTVGPKCFMLVLLLRLATFRFPPGGWLRAVAQDGGGWHEVPCSSRRQQGSGKSEGS